MKNLIHAVVYEIKQFRSGQRMHLLALVLCSMILSVAGCSDSNKDRQPAHAATSVIKLGAILPLTGDLAKYGKTSRSAIELAIEEINQKSEQTGVRFECIFEDDAMNAAQGVSAAKKLVTVDKVPVIIGPLASSITLAVAPITAQGKVILLSPGSSAPGIADANKFIFRNCLSDEFEGSVMGNFVFENLGLRRVAIYHINNDFGVGLAKVFRKSFEAKGGQVLLVESFDQGARDHRTALTKIKAAAPEGTYLVGYDEMISAFRQAKELDFNTQWLGTAFLSDQSLVDKMGNDADGTVLAAWVYNPKSANPKIRNFVTSVRQKMGLDPDVFSANAYDAVHLVAEAIQLRGRTSSDIRDGLLGIGDFDGVTGRTTFEKNGDVKKQIEFKKIEKGKLQPLEVPK